MATEDPRDPTARPPGKPAGMPAEVFDERVNRLVATRRALRAAPGVESVRVWLDDDGEVRGQVYLRDGGTEPFAAALTDHGLSLDLPPSRAVADGGEPADGRTVRFSSEDSHT
ncbi:hypothetical protein [Halorubrum tropicale]|nr:hypothetical protein [Halorubrum tropicale]